MVNMIFGLLGGLGLFLYGMSIMSDGLQRAAGEKIRKILEKVTKYPAVGVLVGAGITAIIQSSSATSVMVVGFVNSGLMNLTQAIGVIMGANIGTTITAQLISFKLTDYILHIIAIGFILFFVTKKRTYRFLGQVLLGFGILFMGLMLMQDVVAPLRDSPIFCDFITRFADYPLLGVLIGVLMTVTIQSSSATIGILIALANQGLIPFESAIPILFGDNIGTCITALLASIGANLNAKRAAGAHLLFNIMGTIIFFALLPFFKEFVYWLTPDNTARLIANAHTSFNILNTVIMLPFVGVLASILQRVLPGEVEEIQRGPIYLNERMLDQPAVALSLSTKELIRMARLADQTLCDAIEGFFKKDNKLIDKAIEKEKIVNELERVITFYLVKLAQKSMTPEQSRRHTGLLHAVNDVERVGDHAENIAEHALTRIEEDLPFSDYAISELEKMFDMVHNVYLAAIEALEKEDIDSAKYVVMTEQIVDRIEKDLRKSHLERLNRCVCYPTSGVLFLDIISNFERISDHSNNIAQIILDKY